MSQLPLMHAPVTTEERYAYLVDLILTQGEIVSDERPFRLTRHEANEYFDEYNAEMLSTAALFKSWEDEKGEHEVSFLEKALELTVKSTLEFLEQQVSEADLYKWGPAS